MAPARSRRETPFASGETPFASSPPYHAGKQKTEFCWVRDDHGSSQQLRGLGGRPAGESRDGVVAPHGPLTTFLAPVRACAVWCNSGRAAQVAVVCIAVRLRASARAELLMRRTALGDVAPSQLDATNPSWWTQQVSNTAASVFWPHHRLLPRKASGLVLLNPGELSGELKDPDDPWGYSHPRWCV